MFGRDQLVRTWTPHIGLGFAKRLASAYAPIRLLLVLIPISWAVGIMHGFSSGLFRTFTGALNATFPVVVLGIATVTLVQLRLVRNAIRRALSNRGFESSSRPSVLTPTRFRSWLADPGVPPELAATILHDEGRAKPESRATDHV